MTPSYTRAVILAPAKLNLSLDITGGDGSGYHLLDGVMLSVDLADIVTLSLRADALINITCTGTGVPVGEENLAAVAARRFFSFTGLPAHGLDIHINKRIPVQAGLAGGSADAAAVLAGLEAIFESGLTPEQMRTLSLPIGADVPFCIMGGCARARGRGELLSALPMPPDCRFVIAKPSGGMNTGAAFRLYDDRQAEPVRPDTESLVSALENGDLDAAGRAMGNVFEDICAVRDVKTLKALMLEYGASGAAMSGSGTAVAGIFRHEEPARRCLDRISGYAPHAFLARPAKHGARVIFAD